MRSTLVSRAAVAAAFVLLAGLLFAPQSAQSQSTADPALIARGEYLTGPAGQCSDCHGAGLHGGSVPGPGGMVPTPNLAGLTMFSSDAAARDFLQTALLPSGDHAHPPMPHYNFDLDDATAIVAYLRQLK